jgi:hypothetical protein
MAKMVRPVKVKRMLLSHVPNGTIFTMGGKQYVKMSDDDRDYEGDVIATTLLPLCLFDIISQTDDRDFGDRISETYLNATSKLDYNIKYCELMYVDTFKKHVDTLRQHIQDRWYVDCYLEDLKNEDQYLYVDEKCNVETGNHRTEKEDGVSNRIGIRVLYAIDPCVVVTVKANAGKESHEKEN